MVGSDWWSLTLFYEYLLHDFFFFFGDLCSLPNHGFPFSEYIFLLYSQGHGRISLKAGKSLDPKIGMLKWAIMPVHF